MYFEQSIKAVKKTRQMAPNSNIIYRDSGGTIAKRLVRHVGAGRSGNALQNMPGGVQPQEDVCHQRLRVLGADF